jgi:type 1 glutamine amidotransferase
MLYKHTWMTMILLLMAALSPDFGFDARSAPRAIAMARPRVVYVTQSKGFKHAVLPESATIMKALGAKHGFDVTLTDTSETAITPETLKNTDVIIFYTTGELPLSDEQKSALLNFVKSGKAFIGIHSATDTFYKWPEYGEMINGYFDGHPWTQDTEVTIKVDDRTHVTTKHLPASLTFKEEIYQFKQFVPERVKVLVSLDTTKTDMTRPGIKAASFPLVWYKSYGKGRVYYSALGHRPDVWANDWYQTMLVNAIKWSAGELK